MTILGVTNSFTGPAEALEIVGNHAYAASGIVSDASSGSAATTLLKFTSGNNYFVGWLNFTNNETATATINLELSFNGTPVISGVEGSSHFSYPQLYYILIPPYTEVELKWGSSGANTATAFLTGEIFRE